MKFLIVDNDQTSREVIGFLLQEEGQAAEGMAWTEQIWNRCREKKFDALVIDLDSNPVKSWEPLRELQRARPDLQVVLLVVENNLELAADAARWGVLEILEKPFEREDLKAVIARLQRCIELSRPIGGRERKAENVQVRSLPPNLPGRWQYNS